nr:MAG TPA: portal protein [Caudoviricetes sp.]
MEREVTGGQEVLTPRIGAEQVRQAAEVLRKYRLGKQNLDRRIIDNEQFWKLRHWEQMEKGGEGGNPQDVRPASGWLVNCILSKHADAMDSYPEPTVLPREPGDRKEAEVLTRILPVILKNNRFKKAYSQAWWNKLKSGCAVYGVFWDGGKLHGLGDIDIRSMDVLNLFWEPGVQSIQESEHFFSTELTPNRRLEEQYPQLAGKLGRSGGQVSRYLYDDKVDTSEQSLVVDWYYHTVEQGRRVLQYCKFVGENVLYATENDPEMAGKGWYDHGQYPFVFDVLFPEEGTPCGYGYVDLCKSAQKQIDLMNQAILKNTLASATPRFFVRSDGAVNENEYADWTRPFVHTNGNLGADSIAPIRVPTLDSVYVAVLQNKIAEMKETASNRDVMGGGTAGGVTAATAIAALQEAGGKLSRNMIDDGYEAFAEVLTLCIELVRQFYDMPRQFRLLGKKGVEFASFDNRSLRPRALLMGGYRVPEFDLEVSAQNETPYKTMEYNQLALQLFQMGFFRSDMAEQALRCLELMEFKNKDALTEVIREGQKETKQKAWLTEALRRTVAMLDKVQGSHLAEALERELADTAISGPAGGADRVQIRKSDAVAQQRARTQQAVRPR